MDGDTVEMDGDTVERVVSMRELARRIAEQWAFRHGSTSNACRPTHPCLRRA
jgi:hypothetical protein